ncbi:MAG TPA: DUF1287 domain-containing protein [Verrucomicrobiae bacterium]
MFWPTGATGVGCFLLLFPLLCFAEINAQKLVTSACSQIGITKSYDPAYRTLSYPGGDVPKETGVCTDVIIRALRQQSLDLQKEVHEDMRANFSAYPKKWGLTKPDKNIDHRRVPNLMTYFKRKGYSQTITQKPADYLPGDIVTWDLGNGITHIGLVSDRRSSKGIPLIIHNIGSGTQEEDLLFGFTITGHYRLK